MDVLVRVFVRCITSEFQFFQMDRYRHFFFVRMISDRVIVLKFIKIDTMLVY